MVLEREFLGRGTAAEKECRVVVVEKVMVVCGLGIMLGTGHVASDSSLEDTRFEICCGLSLSVLGSTSSTQGVYV